MLPPDGSIFCLGSSCRGAVLTSSSSAPGELIRPRRPGERAVYGRDHVTVFQPHRARYLVRNGMSLNHPPADTDRPESKIGPEGVTVTIGRSDRKNHARSTSGASPDRHRPSTRSAPAGARRNWSAGQLCGITESASVHAIHRWLASPDHPATPRRPAAGQRRRGLLQIAHSPDGTAGARVLLTWRSPLRFLVPPLVIGE
jgi:hypothetical protein